MQNTKMSETEKTQPSEVLIRNALIIRQDESGGSRQNLCLIPQTISFRDNCIYRNRFAMCLSVSPRHTILSLSFTRSLSSCSLNPPLSFSLSLVRTLAHSLIRSSTGVLAPASSFHSRDNFPHPHRFEEETRRNVNVRLTYCINCILEYCNVSPAPDRVDAVLFAARKTGTEVDGRRRQKTGRARPSEINEQLARQSHVSE